MKQLTLNKEKASQFIINNAVFFILVVFLIVMGFIKPSFYSWSNITNIINEFSVYGITACAMTVAIICAEFDLSASSVFSWSTVVFILSINSFGLLPALVITLITGVLMGAFNGVLVAWVKMPAFVVTLGTMTAFKGLAFVVTKASPVNTTNPTLTTIGKFQILNGITIAPLVFIVVLLVFFFFLKYTKFGRGIYATGGNYQVAFLSGIGVNFYKFIIFVLLGLCAAISGIMYCSRILAGWGGYGGDLSLYCVTATVIGGTSLTGGTGGVHRTLIGLLVLGVLFNALTLLGVGGSMQRFIRGLVLIIIIMLDAFASRRRKI